MIHLYVIDTLPNRDLPVLSTLKLPYPVSGALQLDGHYPDAGWPLTPLKITASSKCGMSLSKVV
jgi:hypothetical protein